MTKDGSRASEGALNGIIWGRRDAKKDRGLRPGRSSGKNHPSTNEESNRVSGNQRARKTEQCRFHEGGGT